MTKKLTSLVLALVMCLSLCVPALAAENQETETLPPWVEEGETWVPANDIMLREDESCPKGHWRPDGYIYQGYTEGNSALEGFLANGAIGLMGFIPGVGAISLAVTTFSAGTQAHAVNPCAFSSKR